jgi:hypothetical protein
VVVVFCCCCSEYFLRSTPVLVAVDSFNGFLEEETLTYGFDMKMLAPTKVFRITSSHHAY